MTARATLHRALTHPLVMAAKRPLKDALWIARGRAFANPPLPRRVTSVLFICKGNICRSPFAGIRFRQLLDARGLSGVRSASAGISTTQAARAPQEACTAAGGYGHSLDAHEPLQLTRELVREHDLVVVMEADQLRQLRASYPDAADRILLLPLLDEEASGYERFNISDPFGGPLDGFHACYARIDRALQRLLDQLAGAAPVRNSPGERQ